MLELCCLKKNICYKTLGTISSTIGLLTNLGYLDMSYNCLSGNKYRRYVNAKVMFYIVQGHSHQLLEP